jgi:hypothetical protein
MSEMAMKHPQAKVLKPAGEALVQVQVQRLNNLEFCGDNHRKIYPLRKGTFFFFHLGLQSFGCANHIQGEFSPLDSVAHTPVFSETPSQTHQEMCFTNVLGVPEFRQVDT